MAFSSRQRRSLAAKLKYQHVKTRSNQGATLSYLEGWHVIAEANRIFGYDCWDRKTLSPRCVWSERQAGQVAAFYTTKVRITVRAGGETIMREGIGTGFGRAAVADAAHEIGLKAAETDATKRALATFGNPFGLALYDKEHAGVTRPPQSPEAYILSPSEGKEVTFTAPRAFADAAFAAIRGVENLDALYKFWERNRKTLVQLKKTGPGRGPAVLADALIAALKARAQSLGRPPAGVTFDMRGAADRGQQSALAIPKPKRLRDKEHLKYVAQQPCLACGRRPSHAHHVRYAQPHGLGTKVSDEFTVPLCSAHHDELHRTGNEKRWWEQRSLDPLKAAAELWATTRGQTELTSNSDNVMSEAASEATSNGTVTIESNPTAS
jgi:DNA recombination protein Rad52